MYVALAHNFQHGADVEVVGRVEDRWLSRVKAVVGHGSADSAHGELASEDNGKDISRNFGVSGFPGLSLSDCLLPFMVSKLPRLHPIDQPAFVGSRTETSCIAGRDSRGRGILDWHVDIDRFISRDDGAESSLSISKRVLLGETCFPVGARPHFSTNYRATAPRFQSYDFHFSQAGSDSSQLTR